MCAKFTDTLVKQVKRQTPTKKGEAQTTFDTFVQNGWQKIFAQGTKPSSFYSTWSDAKEPYADVHVSLDLSNFIAGKVFEVEILRAIDGTNYQRYSWTTINGAQTVDDIELVATCTSDVPIQVRIRQTDGTGSIDVEVSTWAIGGTEK